MSDLDAMEYNGKTHNGEANKEADTEGSSEPTGVGDEELWDELDTL